MKTMKKTMALLLALVFCMSLLSMATFAATGDLTVDAKVTVTGVETGDTVTAYKFVSWDSNTNNWKVAADVGLTLEQITDGLTKDELATLASNKDKMEAVNAGSITGTTWEMPCGTPETAGSYLILVTDNDQKHIYNPAVVSADFSSDTESTVALLTDDTATIKKQPVTVDKKADNATDDYSVQVGDIVPFTVTVTVPRYNTNWTQPTFEVSDKLSTGLTIKTGPTIAGLAAGTDYTLTKGAEGDDGFTIAFSETYLKNHASEALDIKYTALVGDAVNVTAQIHEETNKVTVTFSNDPTDKTSHETITDETHHYTFSIDASRFGSTSDKTGELVKVGVDKDGKDVTVYKEGDPLPEKTQALAGAEFTLTGVGPNNTPNGYTQTKTSDADGKMNFTDLEVGTYTLQETKAPAGYLKDPNPHTVVVDATYNEDGTLATYSIKIDGADIATYTATTKADKTLDTIVKDENNKTFPINDKKGAELPSTGGIGTKIFYTMGAVLVVGAGVVLVSRKRAGE